MNEELGVKASLIFGHIVLLRAAPRIDGNDLIPRSRKIEYDGQGNVTKDVTFETGVRLVDGAMYASMFAPERPPSVKDRA